MPSSKSSCKTSNTTDFDNGQFELDLASRGRSRSRSFCAEDEEDSGGGRRRGQSFCSDSGQEEDDDGQQDQMIAKAANLSKVYMKGSQPVDPNNLPVSKSGGRKRQTKQQTGALSDKALNTLSEGLKGKANLNKVTEEELEEMKMAREEAENLKKEKQVKKPSASSRAFAFARKAKSTLMHRASGNHRESLTSQSASIDDSDKSSSVGCKSITLDTSAPGEPRKRRKLKLLLLGDSGVGKSSLLRIMSGDKFSESMLATAGVDFKIRNIQIEDYDVALQVWDTAGQERFHRITATYYKGADGIILVYDVNDRNGFDNVGYWMNNIQQYANQLPAMLLVGNKIDLPHRAVSQDEGKATSDEYSCRFLETSAKTSMNVEDALMTVATDALFLSLNEGMGQKELLEKEKLYGRRGLHKENCTIQ